MNRLLGILMVFGLTSVQAEDKAAQLEFGYAEACPHMCPYNEQKGFTTDIARTIFEKRGYRVTFVALPWARAAYQAMQGELDGVLSAGKLETPGMIFPELEIAEQSDCFYGKDSDPWQAGDASSFLNRTTIIFNGWVNERRYRKALGDEVYQQTFEEFSIDSRYYERVLEMVRRGRAHAFWMDSTVFGYLQKHNPELDSRGIKNLGCVGHQYLYLALTPQTQVRSEKLAVEFSEGMQALRDSGELANILQTYGLKDWRH
ncbi:MAG: hypothetical protein H6999_00730 [Hahellaceae bacterium]|nr:hypothetical protein [Hahellaceae bacterium]MCP5168275.1 hypothetical protein [Hahellaceae bacterium]